MTSRLVMLAQDGPSTRIIYRKLKESFGDLVLILEDPMPRTQMAWRRLRKLGFLEVIGQLLFLLLLPPFLRRIAARRIEEINQKFGLDDRPLDERIVHVESVNSQQARKLLRDLDPQVVVVNGTRIIARDTLLASRALFVNTHAGITPRYRGVHGGYWALAEGRPDLAGSTVHVVDEGIDTGMVLAQATFKVTPEDSFVTYPYLHTAAAIPILLRVIERALDEKVEIIAPLDQSVSKLRYHPTIWSYLNARINRGVR